MNKFLWYFCIKQVLKRIILGQKLIFFQAPQDRSGLVRSCELHLTIDVQQIITEIFQIAFAFEPMLYSLHQMNI